MSAEEFCFATLSTAGNVTALVGQKIYPDQVSELSALPYIAFERAGTEYEHTLLNTVMGVRVRLQVVAWAGTRIAAEQIGDAVVVAMMAATVPPAERDSLFDFETSAFASVLGFEVWE